MKKARLAKGIHKLLQGRSKGLTLVEIVIAIALIAIIGVAFLGGLSNAMFSLHIADVRTTAESLARSEMESAKESLYEDYMPGNPPSYTKEGEHSDIYEGYYVWLSALPIDPGTDEVIVDQDGEFLDGYTADLGIQKITVVATQHDRGEVVTLVGYKGKRL